MTHLKQLKLSRPDQLPTGLGNVLYNMLVTISQSMQNAVNQIEIHPFLAWDECVSFCEQENIKVMAYSPLAKAMKLKTVTLTQIANKYDVTYAHVTGL